MAYFKTQDFISKVRKDDLARSNRFEIVINSPANMATDREVSYVGEGELARFCKIAHNINDWID